jgi:hypothetical protein
VLGSPVWPQVVFEPQTHAEASKVGSRLRSEWVVAVKGQLRLRKDPNSKIKTGKRHRRPLACCKFGRGSCCAALPTHWMRKCMPQQLSKPSVNNNTTSLGAQQLIGPAHALCIEPLAAQATLRKQLSQPKMRATRCPCTCTPPFGCRPQPHPPCCMCGPPHPPTPPPQVLLSCWRVMWWCSTL